MVSKIVKKLIKKGNYIYQGKLEVLLKVSIQKIGRLRDQLLFKSTIFGDDTDRPLQKADGHGLILLVIWHTIHIKFLESLMF